RRHRGAWRLAPVPPPVPTRCQAVHRPPSRASNASAGGPRDGCYHRSPFALPTRVARRMSITQNKKAFHDYTIEERFEAGLVLEGWEVKSIRANQAHLKEAYVIVRGGELWLLNAHITPLKTASTHITPEPTRTRKLLMRAEEIRKLIG